MLDMPAHDHITVEYDSEKLQVCYVWNIAVIDSKVSKFGILVTRKNHCLYLLFGFLKNVYRITRFREYSREPI